MDNYQYTQLESDPAGDSFPKIPNLLTIPRQGNVVTGSSRFKSSPATKDYLSSPDSEKSVEDFWNSVLFKGMKAICVIIIIILLIITGLLCIICATVILISTLTPEVMEETMILVSIDAFKPEYLTWFPEQTKTLNRIKSEGVSAQRLQSVFPTKTFPNHYTIVTGLYPEHHGIVSNVMRDPSRPGQIFHINEPIGKDPFWWGGEPLWVTAESQGIRTGAVFWIGSEVMIKGIRPTFYEKYNQSIDSSTRVDHAMNYLNVPQKEKRPRLIFLYFDIVDTISHYHYLYSPLPQNNEKLKAAVAEVDAALDKLIRALENKFNGPQNFNQKVNLVVVSDHGMSPTPKNKILRIDEMTHSDFNFENCLEHLNNGPIVDLWIKDSCKDQKQTILNSLKTKIPNAHAYAKEEIPEKYHYKNNPRIPDILVLADDEYSLSYAASPFTMEGEHGYDHELASMNGIFIAKGPAFKAGGVVYEMFQNVHIYNLLANALRLKPAQNDGNFEIVKPLLK